MRKLNIKLLSTVSALAFVVAGAAARADVTLSPSLDPSNWTYSALWNEQNAEGALGAAIDQATQVALFYGVEAGTGTAPVTIEAKDLLTIDEAFWTSLNDSSYWWEGSQGVGIFNGNSLSANTTIRDAEITDVSQTAYISFQSINVDVLANNEEDSVSGLTTIEVQQFLDGANEGGYWWNEASRDTAYTFELISRNEIDASASQQGTAIIDAQTLDANDELVNGTQQAVVALNSIAVSAADDQSVVINLGGDSLVGLNNNDYYYGGQGFDVQGVSGGSNYWDTYWNGNSTGQDNEDPFIDYEQFTLEATNWAGAYAPHSLTANDPAVMNLDQKAFVTANTITVGNTVLNDGASSEDYGSADFTIMATVESATYASFDPENGSYELGQFANFNGNDNNLASFYWGDNMGAGSAVEDGYMNLMSEVNVRNTAVATTILDDYAFAAGGADVSGVDLYHSAYWGNDSLNGGLVDGLNDLPNKYTEGYGDVALESIVQVASVGVNAISNIGSGDLKLISGVSFDPENSDYISGTDFVQDLSFTQSVHDFVFSNQTVNAGSSFYNGEGTDANGLHWDDPTDGFTGPEGFVNTALATTEVGDVNLSGVDQTTSFAFNSIRSVGDILGWTSLDGEEGSLSSTEYDSSIVQYADTSFYITNNSYEVFGGYWTASGNEDALNGIDGWTADGNVDGTDLTQVTSITANTMASNSNITADITQTAIGEWRIEEPNDLELGTSDGAVTGDNLSQTALFTANSITTADLVVTIDPENPATVFTGGDLVAAYVTQDASGLEIQNYSYWWDGATGNEIDLAGDTIDMGKMSQVFQVSLNKIDVAGSILIGDGTDSGLLSQVGTDYDLSVFNDIYTYESTGDVSLAAAADDAGIQAAYLNVNTIAAGDTLSGNVDQDINAEYYSAENTLSGYSSAGTVDVANFTQSAQINLNEITAGTYVDANIDQHIETDLSVNVQNLVDSISDTGAANIEGITQQAIARINTIGG